MEEKYYTATVKYYTGKYSVGEPVVYEHMLNCKVFEGARFVVFADQNGRTMYINWRNIAEISVEEEKNE